MFQLPGIGGTLAVSHYAAILCVGFIMRFHGASVPPTPEPRADGSILQRAARELYEARRRDGRPLGTLFADAVKESMLALFFIGGTIMMFSVLIRLMDASGIIGGLTALAQKPLDLFGVDGTLTRALFVGTVEITNGAKAASVANAPLMHKVVVTSAVIAWSGLSVHAQVAAMLHGTNIRIAPYVLARTGHAVLAGAFAWLLMGPAQQYISVSALPVLSPLWAAEALSFSARLYHATASATQIGLVGAVIVGLGAAADRCRLLWIKMR